MLIVQKFGGTSVADLTRIRAAAKRCLDTHRAGHERQRGSTLQDLPHHCFFSSAHCEQANHRGRGAAEFALVA